VSKSKVVFVTRNKNSDDRLGEIIAKKIEDHFGIRSLSINYDILIVDENEGRGDILNILKQKYGCLNPSLYVAKTAGMKVPEGTKKIAEACISDIDDALSELDVVKNNFEHNISEYEKIQDDADLVRKTKGMYNQSSLKSKTSVEKTLSKILSILKSMDGIKDVSTTSELIDGVVSTTKVYIDYVQNVFDVIEKFDDINFFGILSENTSAAISAIDDCKEALSRMENYVYNHILGVVPLSG
jgi:DNA-binding transcriptional ArsR family regulator